MDLSISNVVNISVSQSGQGVGKYNTSNLALVSHETPEVSFGTLGYKLYVSPDDVATDFGSNSVTYKMALAVFSQQPNILAPGGYLCVIPYLVDEVLHEAITRTIPLVQYFGVMSTRVEIQADRMDAAEVVQAELKMLFVVSRTVGDIAPGAGLDFLRSGNFSHTRGLYHGVATDLEALIFQASYAGRALSTEFSGNNTTQTMHMKDLISVQPDPTMGQTQLAQAIAAGVDTYVSIQGVAKVYCSGLNGFFDDIYNLMWMVGELKVAGFNLIAQTSTKIVQTEDGITSLKGAYRKVCEQAVTNQFLAPGLWTNPNTFGNQADLFDNIAQRGYYIYSQPVAQQLPSDRAARKAPVIQIAVKYAGAVHSSSVIVNVNK